MTVGQQQQQSLKISQEDMTKEGSGEPTGCVQSGLEFGKVVVFKGGGECKSKSRAMSACMRVRGILKIGGK